MTPVPTSTDSVDRYLTSGSRQVRGWLRPEAGQLIAELVRGQDASGAIGEIGVHHGKLFVLLALLRNDGEAGLAVDVFEEQDKNVDGSGHGDRLAFENNLTRHAVDQGITIKMADSSMVSGEDLIAWAGGPFKVFSVDGGHTAELTEHDLSIAALALAPGGLLILDDYFNESWPGVSEGTNRFLTSQPGVEAVGSGHGKTFFTDAEHADGYRARMAAIAAAHGWLCTVQPFFGRPHVIVRRQSGRARRAGQVRGLGKRVPGLAPAVRAIRKRVRS